VSAQTADAVICGAGIAGISAAYHLTRAGVRNVLLIEAGEPLSLTSDKSTECYRNFWPGPGDGMVRLVNRSLDQLEALAEQSGNVFHLNRRGYLYCTSDPARLEMLRHAAEESSALGAGPVRIHPGSLQAYQPDAASAPPDGFDLLADASLVRTHFPYLSDSLVGALHVRRAGWFSAQQLGRLLLERAREAGARLVDGEVQAVETRGGRVHAVQVASDSGALALSTPVFINAAGPFVKKVAHMLGADLPVVSEVHTKASFRDVAGAVPRQAPLLILSDPQTLLWTDEERAALCQAGDHQLLEEMPSGVHARPEGATDSPILLALWPYHTPVCEPSFPLAFDPAYPEIVLRGLSALLPGVRGYLDHMPRPFVDGGYYTRTRENRPLIGPLGPPGTFVIGALSGFGLMAALGAGELLSAHVTGDPLPEHARWFMPSRYDDLAYRSLLDSWEATGQL